MTTATFDLYLNVSKEHIGVRVEVMQVRTTVQNMEFDTTSIDLLPVVFAKPEQKPPESIAAAGPSVD